MWHEKRARELNRKKTSRKRLKSTADEMRLIKEDAMLVMITKLNKEKETERKRVEGNFMKMWRMKRDEIHTKRIVVRKDERNRIKKMKDFMKSNLSSIFDELIQFISDSEAIWKATNEV